MRNWKIKLQPCFSQKNYQETIGSFHVLDIKVCLMTGYVLHSRYLCARCDSLQDATRYTELRQLPPVLHFSLLRFVYDISSMERKKSKNTILFPTTLDMDQFLGSAASSKTTPSDVSANGNMYELRGVLLHKGTSAYHGHYEAQVFDST